MSPLLISMLKLSYNNGLSIFDLITSPSIHCHTTKLHLVVLLVLGDNFISARDAAIYYYYKELGLQ